jgi:hypothetical protein
MRKLFLLSLIFLCSCGSVKNNIESTLETNVTPNSFPFFDQGLNVHYQISNNNDFLHIKLNINDKFLINKIINTGLKICFDVKGKKNDKVYLEFPIFRKQMFSDRIIARSTTNQVSSATIGDLISQIPDEAIFGNQGNMIHFSVSENKTNIAVSISQGRGNAIIYNLIIPINRITKGNLSSLNNLSIGFVTEKVNVPNIAQTIPDISGSSALGDVATYDRNGNRVSNGKTFSTSVGGNTASSASRGNNARLAPVDRFARRSQYDKTKTTECWVKVSLKKD